MKLHFQPGTPISVYYQRILVLIVGILGIGLRFVTLGTKSLWDDEIITIQISKEPLSQIWTILSQKQNSPPLYFWLEHIFFPTNENEFTVRLLSAVFGVLVLIVGYLLAKNIFGKYSALFSLIIMAISPFYIYYSQEVRMYTVWTFLLILSYYSLILCLKNPSRFYLYAFYLVSTVLAAYTHFFTAFHLVAQAIIVFLAFISSKRKLSLFWILYIIIWGIIGLLSIPVLQLASQGFPHGSGATITSWTLALVFEKFGLIGQVILGLPGSQFPFLAVILTIFFGIGLFYRLKDKFKTKLFLLIWLLIPSLFGVFFLEGRSFFHIRYFLPVTIPFLLLVGEGLRVAIYEVAIRINKRIKSINQSMYFRLFVILVSMIMMIIFIQPLNQYFSTEKENIKGAHNFIIQNMLPGDKIVLTGFSLEFLKYYFSDVNDKWVQPNNTVSLKTLSQNGRRVWYVFGWDNFSTGMYPEMIPYAKKNASIDLYLPGDADVHAILLGPDQSTLMNMCSTATNTYAENPNDLSAGLTASNCLLTLGDNDKAKISLEKVVNDLWIKLDENKGQRQISDLLSLGLLSLGDLYKAETDWDTAAKTYNDAMALDSTGEINRDDMLPVFKHFFDNPANKVQIDRIKKNFNLFENSHPISNTNGWVGYLPPNSNSVPAQFKLRNNCIDGQNCFEIVSLQEDFQGGYYQFVDTFPNTLYYYSVNVNTEKPQKLQILDKWYDPFHFGAEAEVNSKLSWQNFYTIFRVPNNINKTNFFPVILQNQGAAQFSEPTLVEIPWFTSRTLQYKIKLLENQFAESGTGAYDDSKLINSLLQNYRQEVSIELDNNAVDDANASFASQVSFLSKVFHSNPSNSTWRSQYLATYQEYIAFLEKYKNGINRGQNELNNSGFESGLQYWDHYSPEKDSNIFKVDSQVAYSGNASGYIDGKTNAYHGGFFQELNLEPNHVYLLRGKFKGNNIENLKLQFLYSEYLQGDKHVGQSGVERNLNSDSWKTIETVLLTASDQDVTYLFPVLVTGQGEVWIDDIELIRLDGKN